MEIVDFSRIGQAQRVWSLLQVEEAWEKGNGYQKQFLGNAQIPRQDSEQLLNMVAHNLARTKPLTFRSLCERFDRYDVEQNWVKVTTFALSEHAYYDESDAGYWQSLCDRLSLENTQGVQKCFREILDIGFRRLEVVETQQANHYVSTLWLQSGIPQKNLEHFARLLEEISGQYDWWEISHAKPEDLADLLYEHCQNHHSQWGKLITFLSNSCAQNGEEIAPVSGELLQGLAIVAQSLEQKGLEPKVLKNKHQRESLLQNFCLPNTFFLRSWDNLIRVLTPQKSSLIQRKSIVSFRKKPLILVLDVNSDSLDIQLVLPEQTPWKADWQKLRETYVQIKGCSWESTFPREGPLKIESQQKMVSEPSHSWTWRLKSHSRMTLLEWYCEGISTSLPALAFDAWTGERLSLPHMLKGRHSEIFFFYDSSAQLEFSGEVELIDGFVPCSISGWRGQQLYLDGRQAQLKLTFNGASTVIPWSSYETDNVPQLKGLRLKNKDAIYIEMPSVWYPPQPLPKTINIQVEDLNSREVLTQIDERLTVSNRDRWQQIPLSKWIQRSGCFAVQIWQGSDRWSARFELRSSAEIAQPSLFSSPQLYEFGEPVTLPISVNSASEFWLKDLPLQNLWPFEDIHYLLTNGKEKHCFTKQANISGKLPLKLAPFHDVLPLSEQYSLLYYDQSGKKSCLLKVLDKAPVNYALNAQAIELSGLQSIPYTLSLWNLLQPEKAAAAIPFIFDADAEPFSVLLRAAALDVFGLFHIQLENPMHAPVEIGWWSGIESIENLEVPDNADEDCCYNILGNESVEDFKVMFQAMDLSIHGDRLKRAIANIDSPTHYLPTWINRSLLKEKLTTCLPQLVAPSIICEEKKELPLAPTRYLIEVEDGSKQKMFQKMLEKDLKKKKINEKVIRIKEKLLSDLIMVELATPDVLSDLSRTLMQLGERIGTSAVLTKWER